MYNLLCAMHVSVSQNAVSCHVSSNVIVLQIEQIIYLINFSQDDYYSPGLFTFAPSSGNAWTLQ